MHGVRCAQRTALGIRRTPRARRRVVVVSLARVFCVRSQRERVRSECERELSVDRALRALARERLYRARGFVRRLIQCLDRARDSRGLEPERVRERARG